MYKQLYQAIETRLKTIEDTQGSRIFKTIDLWNEQWNYIDHIPPFPFPAIFVEFANAPYRTTGKHIQRAEQIINLHMGAYSLASSREGSSNQLKALQHLRLIDDIHYWLARFGGDFFSTFNRMNVAFDHNHSATYAHVLTYKTMIADDAAEGGSVKIIGDKLIITLEQ